MMSLFIHSDSPCNGAGLPRSGLRLARALVKNGPAAEVTVFPLADVVSYGKKGQKKRDDPCNLQRMLKRLTSALHRLVLSDASIDARWVSEAEMVEAARRSSMEELAAATLEAGGVIVFRRVRFDAMTSLREHHD